MAGGGRLLPDSVGANGGADTGQREPSFPLGDSWEGCHLLAPAAPSEVLSVSRVTKQHPRGETGVPPITLDFLSCCRSYRATGLGWEAGPGNRRLAQGRTDVKLNAGSTGWKPEVWGGKRQSLTLERRGERGGRGQEKSKPGHCPSEGTQVLGAEGWATAPRSPSSSWSRSIPSRHHGL